MHRYWSIKHLITIINSSGLHWRGALLPFNAGPSFHAPSFLFPLLPCLLFSLAFTPYGLPFWQNLTQWSTPAAPATLPLPGLFALNRSFTLGEERDEARVDTSKARSGLDWVTTHDKPPTNVRNSLWSVSFIRNKRLLLFSTGIGARPLIYSTWSTTISVIFPLA